MEPNCQGTGWRVDFQQSYFNQDNITYYQIYEWISKVWGKLAGRDGNEKELLQSCEGEKKVREFDWTVLVPSTILLMVQSPPGLVCNY